MFNSIRSRIFISFSALIVLATLAIGYFIADIHLEEQETYVLDVLTSRAKAQGALLEAKIASGKTVLEVVREQDFVLVRKDGSLIKRVDQDFYAEDALKNLPPSGSFTRPCQKGRSLCSFTYMPSLGLWLFNSVKRGSLTAVLQKSVQKIGALILALVGLSLFLSFLIASTLTNSLKGLKEATKQIMNPDFSPKSLSPSGPEEVRTLKAAFQKMVEEIRIRERNLEEAALKLAHSERLATVGQMGASIAHEVKNPLMSIAGYAKVIQKQGSLPEVEEAAEIIQKESARCNQILQQMLRFSRNDPQEKRPYRITELIESSLLLIQSEAKKCQIEIKTELHEDCVIEGNAQQVQQVLINLLINAIHASSPKSEVLVFTRLTDGLCEIGIQDHGSGIPPDIAGHIFEPFFTTKEKASGTGLGLSVSKTIVDEQGGRLEFDTREGEGSCFRILLPVALA